MKPSNLPPDCTLKDVDPDEEDGEKKESALFDDDDYSERISQDLADEWKE